MGEPFIYGICHDHILLLRQYIFEYSIFQIHKVCTDQLYTKNMGPALIDGWKFQSKYTHKWHSSPSIARFIFDIQLNALLCMSRRNNTNKVNAPTIYLACA